VIAVKEKMFPELSEDAWLLYADGFGDRGHEFLLTPVQRFTYLGSPPDTGMHVSEAQWRAWNGRLRPFLLQPNLLAQYRAIACDARSQRLGDVARVGIGYVTGANDFFHLRPSVAKDLGIPESCLHTAVRNGRALTEPSVTKATVKEWLAADEAVLLLRLTAEAPLPGAVRKYLDSHAGQEARLTYKCRNRRPWYVVPDVHVPDAFLSYMSGGGPSLVENRAECVGTNSVHTVRMKPGCKLATLMRQWNNSLRELSCEVEGHPLGGGMLKVEPREAARIVIGQPNRWSPAADCEVREGLATLRSWRHCES
jgi:hypothetical protein